jgi:hypothetical protein
MKNTKTNSIGSTVAPAAVLTAAVGSDVEALKKAILFRWGHCQKELGPLFSRLRSKLKAQGKKGEGFGTWLDAHGIPRSTADRWADQYETSIGLRSAKKASLKLTTSHSQTPSTFPQTEKGGAESHANVETGVYIERIMLAFSKQQRKAFEEAEQKLRSVYRTENVTDTVYALVMERCASLPVEAADVQEVR